MAEDFAAGLIERNLREMFRILASERAAGTVKEMTGLTIASVGSAFQMFNAAFFNSPVREAADLERRIALAQAFFAARGLPWSLWVCEDLVAEPLRKRVKRYSERLGLHMGSEMPAMWAARPIGPAGSQNALRIRAVDSGAQLTEFCQIGADCFRVPLPWFQEIYSGGARLRGRMETWVGYSGGVAVCTVAAVPTEESFGIYNLATLPAFRQRGFGEIMLRHAAQFATKPLVLQSTKQGLRLYERLGFESVSRIVVFPSNSGARAAF